MTMRHRPRLRSLLFAALAVCALAAVPSGVFAAAPHDAGIAEKTSAAQKKKTAAADKKKAPTPGEKTGKKTPAAARPCASDAACASGEHCSTRDGICLPPPDCKPGQMCAEVCYGTCVPDKAASSASLCEADRACRVRASYCGGCRCEAVLAGASVAPCAGPTAACLADPCAKQKAVCQKGTCALAPL